MYYNSYVVIFLILINSYSKNANTRKNFLSTYYSYYLILTFFYIINNG